MKKYFKFKYEEHNEQQYKFSKTIPSNNKISITTKVKAKRL